MNYASWVPAGIKELHKQDMKAWKQLDDMPNASHSKDATPCYVHMEKLLSSESFGEVWDKLLLELRRYSNRIKEERLQPSNLTRSEVVLFSILISSFNESRQNFFVKTKLSLRERSDTIKKIEKNLNKISKDLELLGINVRGRDIIAKVDEPYSFLENYGLLSNALLDASDAFAQSPPRNQESELLEPLKTFHAAMRSLLFSDFFNEVTIPTVLSRLHHLQSIGGVSQTDSLEKRVCAYMLVVSFKMNLGKECRTHAAKIIEIIFSDPKFDEGRLGEVITSMNDNGRLGFPNHGNLG